MTSARRYRGVRPIGEDHGVRLKRPDLIPDHVTHIPYLIERILTPQRRTCDACGCLCKLDEVCPGCLSNRITLDRFVGEGSTA